MRALSSIHVIIAAVAGAFCSAALLIFVIGAAPAIAAEATLPPELVARMDQDLAQAEAALAAERRRLGTVARRQQLAAAASARLHERGALVRSVAELGPLSVPASIDTRLQAGEDAAATALEQRDRELVERTERAASFQARALDADRRIRALRRASATENDRDTTLGSWRFGSGGPAVSAASIDGYLASKGSPLAGQGAAFLESGVQHGIDPRLVVAIAGAESYFGITTCAPFNAWGWGCPNGPYRFESWARGIETVTLGLREGYIDGGRTTVGEIHLRYAPPDADNDPTDLNYAWPNNVARFLAEQGGDPQSIAGVLGPSR